LFGQPAWCSLGLLSRGSGVLLLSRGSGVLLSRGSGVFSFLFLKEQIKDIIISGVLLLSRGSGVLFV
jgi:hypothetical protein